MLRLLASFSPILVLLLGAIPAALGMGGLAWLKFELVDRPAIVRETLATAEAKCTIRTQLAADAAEKAERERQQAVSADALDVYRRALAQSETRAADAAQQLEQEIADYEDKLLSQGRLCAISEPDLDFLYGRNPAGPN